MHQIRPLPDTHPELTEIFYWQGFTEYRVENWRLARDGSGRVVRATSVFSWVDAGVLVLAAICVMRGYEPMRLRHFVVCITIAVIWLWARLTQVLHESVLVFPTLGIQLETHRGHPLIPRTLFTSRYFIPLSALEDVVIHEGLRGWNVRFYLALLQRRRANRLGEPDVLRGGNVEVHVAFENILPYFSVLKEVYLGVHQTLFPTPTPDEPSVRDSQGQ